MVDKNGISYARKAMIITGFLLGTNGVWSDSQLSGDFQAIMEKHSAHLDGLPVNPVDVETKSESEHEKDHGNIEGDKNHVNLRRDIQQFKVNGVPCSVPIKTQELEPSNDTCWIILLTT